MTRVAMICSALTALALAAPGAPRASADDPPGPTPTIRPGEPLSAVELAQILGAEIWKFQVDLPPDATRFSARLTVRQKGKEARPFAAVMSGPLDKGTRRDVLIAIIPVNGTAREADKVRVVVSALGITLSNVEGNPLKGLGTGRHEMPVDQKDGSFALIGGYRGDTVAAPITTADTVLAWKVEATRD